MWLDQWHNPLETSISIADPALFLKTLEQPVQVGSAERCELLVHEYSGRGFNREAHHRSTYVDKIPTGFLLWPSTMKGYKAVPEGESALVWDPSSTDVLRAMVDALRESDFLPNLVSRWSQESSQNIASPELRVDNVTYMKSLGT